MLGTALTYMRCEDAPGPEPVAPVASGEAPSARAVLVRGRVTTYDVRVKKTDAQLPPHPPSALCEEQCLHTYIHIISQICSQLICNNIYKGCP